MKTKISTYESKNKSSNNKQFLTLENFPDRKVGQRQCLTHNVGHRLQRLVQVGQGRGELGGTRQGARGKGQPVIDLSMLQTQCQR